MKKLLIISFCVFFVNLKNVKSQTLYDVTNITTIYLTFTDPNWDATLDNYYSVGLDQRLLATCVINGVQFDSVGVKYKGNSTYNPTNPKNPFNIKLDYIIGSQDYQGYSTIKLSNGKNDPSFVREVLSYEIARKYMDAPLSNYAKIYVNGNYHGMYSSSESINKKFVGKRFYANDQNTLFKCNPTSTGNGGSSLEYLGTDSSLYFNYYELQSSNGWNDMVYFTNQLTNNFNNVESAWDIDRSIWMLAFDNVLVSLDSYIGPFKQNFYLFKDDHNRFNPIVWDMNESLGGFEMISSGPPSPPNITSLQQLNPLLRQGDNSYPLANNIFNNTRYQKMYMAHFRTILEENFTNGDYHNRANTLQNLIYNDVNTDPNAIYSISDFTNNITTQISGQSGAFGITQLMDARVTFLQSNAEYIKVSPAISNIQNSPIVQNTTVNITADINNGTYAYLGYRNSIANIFTKVEMFDDGVHNDGAAGDDTYGVTIPVGSTDIQYYIYSDNSVAGKFSPERAEHEFYTLVVIGDLVINELSAINNTIQADQNGEFDDWIELYNNTSSPIILDGDHLSDENNNITKWTFPNGTTINANSFLIIWADNDTLQTGLHANFKLSSTGEALYLSNPAGNLLDETSFGVQTTDVTWGRYPNGTGVFTTMNPTFSYNNSNWPIKVDEVNLEDNGFNIYPNPANEIVNIEFNLIDNQQLYIYSILGNLVYKSKLTETHVKLDVSNWGKGIYLVKTNNNVKKLVIR